MKQPKVSFHGKWQNLERHVASLLLDGWFISDFYEGEDGLTQVSLYRPMGVLYS